MVAERDLLEFAHAGLIRADNTRRLLLSQIRGLELGAVAGVAVATATYGTPAVLRCVANIVCRTQLYFEATAALEAAVLPGSVPTIAELSFAARNTILQREP